ncbi:hypothetical protein CONCODRAFT_3037 [Conidiobolus coronatus NRRL 28638]|uniref:propionyl-CoA carboxylase n=1 Tax=Conidiobolus coronatus (strain ATCC 28846 / CBS 209.66 / NRRL 28638) TaxID=796925 RepID=A0A137PG60_CONC2|nr:hypothetical protein CONCODRAFT_3037 [Conidiobolus coronatus NRRL 28638]|eukprot:KXN73965.1 hypothetical protein CONCODRAFT_3037 [Conidiobolus coronatus NRRL 28638]
MIRQLSLAAKISHKSLGLRSLSSVASTQDYGKTFDKILIANRGEIACRVIRTAKKMGIKTVAIYSDADATSLHTRSADEAVNVGPAPTSQSYLNIPKIVEGIKSTGAQAVHPGYGFLSENSAFVKALDEANVSFIGPGEHAMAAMGDKIQSKIIAKESGVNTIPGFNGVVKDVDHALEISREIGYPVMLKASAGGGGKGMRIAWNDEEVASGFKIASTESMSSFGDSRLLVEKFIEEPRHIEIQILADKHGNTIYLPERECSIQRRNQKVVEEAPSSFIDPATRKAMGEQAVALAKHVGYSSAGTVEFLVDKHRNFYFLEMNTRLQVEHPITEYITGIDLVEQMIRVAAGQPLSIKQEDVQLKGWAIESRVYAEDPEKYLPSIGRLSKYIEPTSTKGENEVRCDTGIVEGSEISIYYDPMICKLCTYGATRDEAIERMKKALDSYVIKGVTHNIPLLREIVSHPKFGTGDITTKFLEQEYPEGFKGHALNSESLHDLIGISAAVHAKREIRNRTWSDISSSIKAPEEWKIFVKVDNANDNLPLETQVKKIGENEFEVTIDGKSSNVNLDWKLESPLVNAQVDGRPITTQYLEPKALGFIMQHYGTKFNVTIHSEIQNHLSQYIKEKPKQDMNKFLISPMPGSIVSIAVKEGDVVAEGTELAVVEAMKMQNVLRATKVGKVKKIHAEVGASVAGEDIIIEFEDDSAAKQ